MARMHLPLLVMSIAIAASGCTYLEVRENVGPNGALAREQAAANAQLQRAKSEQEKLSDLKLQRERELDRMDRRIKAAQEELAIQDTELTSALTSKKLSKASYDDMKRQLDAIRGEMANLDLQNKSEQYSNQKPNPQSEALKQEKLKALEERKQKLEATLMAALKR